MSSWGQRNPWAKKCTVFKVKGNMGGAPTRSAAVNDYPHFKDKDTGAQRGELSCPKSLVCKRVELALERRLFPLLPSSGWGATRKVHVCELRPV